MPRKRHKPEEIVAKLRRVDVCHYNAVRPHGSLGYKPPAPEVFVPALAARAASQSRPATPPALASKPSMH